MEEATGSHRLDETDDKLPVVRPVLGPRRTARPAHEGDRNHISRYWPLYAIMAITLGGAISLTMALVRLVELNNDTPRFESGATSLASSRAHPRVSLPPGAFTDGTWRVGKDIKAGKYRAVVPSDSPGCYWARLNIDNDPTKNVIVNDMVVEGAAITVTIVKTDAFFDTQGCGVWKPV